MAEDSEGRQVTVAELLKRMGAEESSLFAALGAALAGDEPGAA